MMRNFTVKRRGAWSKAHLHDVIHSATTSFLDTPDVAAHHDEHVNAGASTKHTLRSFYLVIAPASHELVAD